MNVYVLSPLHVVLGGGYTSGMSQNAYIECSEMVSSFSHGIIVFFSCRIPGCVQLGLPTIAT